MSYLSVCPKKLGKVLREHRQSAGMSLHEAAEKSDLSVQTVLRLEKGQTSRVNGDVTAKLSSIEDLAYAVGVRDSRYLFTMDIYRAIA